ncbi:hypothetical protein MSAN_00281200 [Mycena sanguinolenta]|uniref:Uncharacterized protein n=1 Tax=Mycena sanguinolenta TaxID=230812 RepID=A0A8H7DIZ5_9AGAR|nr:hypothetical protein MSAN_00281200 [Mycena sanguinolenta]
MLLQASYQSATSLARRSPHALPVAALYATRRACLRMCVNTTINRHVAALSRSARWWWHHHRDHRPPPRLPHYRAAARAFPSASHACVSRRHRPVHARSASLPRATTAPLPRRHATAAPPPPPPSRPPAPSRSSRHHHALPCSKLLHGPPPYPLLPTTAPSLVAQCYAPQPRSTLLATTALLPCSNTTIALLPPCARCRSPAPTTATTLAPAAARCYLPPPPCCYHRAATAFLPALHAAPSCHYGHARRRPSRVRDALPPLALTTPPLLSSPASSLHPWPAVSTPSRPSLSPRYDARCPVLALATRRRALPIASSPLHHPRSAVLAPSSPLSAVPLPPAPPSPSCPRLTLRPAVTNVTPATPRHRATNLPATTVPL